MSRQTFTITTGGGRSRKCGKKLATSYSRYLGMFDRRANVGLHHLALAVVEQIGLDTLYKRVSSWPGVVVEFGPEPSGAGPKIHFIVREPSGVRIEFAFDPRLEEARKAR